MNLVTYVYGTTQKQSQQKDLDAFAKKPSLFIEKSSSHALIRPEAVVGVRSTQLEATKAITHKIPRVIIYLQPSYTKLHTVVHYGTTLKP